MKIDAGKLIKNFFKLENTPKDKAMAKKLQAAVVREEYANGDLICKKGEKAKAMFFIESGKVEIIGTNNQVLNELEQGAYFGEYAVLTGDKRLSSVRSKGGTVVYRLKSKDVFLGIRYKPAAYGDLIKQLYGQISSKHTKLLTLSSTRRGLVRDPKNKKRMSIPKLLIHYGLILAVFLLAAFLPSAENPAPAWVLLPIAFLITSIIITKRSLESIVLASLLAVVILFRFDFIFVFYDSLIGTISDGSTMEIILILFLLGSVSRLLSSSGGINAMRRMVSERIQTQRGSLLTSLLCIIIIFVDDCLSLLIAGVCFMPVNDKKRVSREMSAFVMGMPPVAVGTLVPLSVCGVFIIGIITLTIGENGAALFYKSIPFNFASVLIILLAVFAATGKMPLVGALKKAQNRVKKGGSLWPPNSENYFAENDESTRGNIINLFLPIFVLIASSIISGTITEGKFAINIGYGLLISLGFMFLLYIFQRLMTPEEFFDNIITGAENMLVPVILLAVTLCFSTSVSRLGLIEWLSEIMAVFSGDNVWMLPAVLYILFTVISALLGSSMSMYVFGLPIAIQLAMAVGGNLPLCIGAICAAGVTGDGLSFYQADNLFVASVIGIEPTAIVTARFPYFLMITLLVAAGYVVAGIAV